MTPLEIFEKIAKDIPRCSSKADRMRDFIVSWAKNIGYETDIDDAGNILCRKNTPARVCLQAHYDMVCVGDVSRIEPVIKDGWMHAKNSSLGADNGIGVAMMLSYMEYFDDLEFLFTADEEIGLIGAKNISLRISSNKVLNLDSEEEGMVYVACAGGVDTKCEQFFETVDADEGEFWEIGLTGLPGGHSGVDIDKNIPNASIELAKKLLEKNAQIASFEGGEKRNSIPSNARAVVCLKDTEGLDGYTLAGAQKTAVLKNSEVFLKSILNAPNGALERNLELGVVETSSNIGITTLVGGKCEIRVSSRSMSKIGLDGVAADIKEHFEANGYKTNIEDSYEPWEWSEDEFCVFVKSVYKKYYLNVNFKAIHAGLECAALKKHFRDASFASVGPNIEYPHSLGERVELESVGKTYEAIFEVLRQAKA